MTPSVEAWLDWAASDLRTAKRMFYDCYPREYNISCYHCHQCCEKSIKAVYLGLNILDFPKTHDLNFLLEQIKNSVSIEVDLYNISNDLNKFAVVTKYPNQLELDDFINEKSIEKAEKIYNWAFEFLNGLK